MNQLDVEVFVSLFDASGVLAEVSAFDEDGVAAATGIPLQS